MSLRKRRGDQGEVPGVADGRGVIPGGNAVPIGVEGGNPPCDAQGGSGSHGVGAQGVGNARAVGATVPGGEG